jgi:hypothetical protein
MPISFQICGIQIQRLPQQSLIVNTEFDLTRPRPGWMGRVQLLAAAQID